MSDTENVLTEEERMAKEWASMADEPEDEMEAHIHRRIDELLKIMSGNDAKYVSLGAHTDKLSETLALKSVDPKMFLAVAEEQVAALEKDVTALGVPRELWNYNLSRTSYDGGATRVLNKDEIDALLGFDREEDNECEYGEVIEIPALYAGWEKFIEALIGNELYGKLTFRRAFRYKGYPSFRAFSLRYYEYDNYTYGKVYVFSSTEFSKKLIAQYKEYRNGLVIDQFNTESSVDGFNIIGFEFRCDDETVVFVCPDLKNYLHFRNVKDRYSQNDILVSGKAVIAQWQEKILESGDHIPIQVNVPKGFKLKTHKGKIYLVKK